MRVTVSLSGREHDDWRGAAACREVDPELFFRNDGDRWGALWAKAVCARCKVRDECLQDAFDNGELWYGVLGGMTPTERVRAWRKLAKVR